MKTSILGIVLALGMISTAFAVFPVSAAVSYTGSVVTTDSAGVPKSVYFQGDPVYVNVELKYQGAPYDGYVTVYLERTTDESRPTHFHAWTDNPATGWNNGSVSGSSLQTWYGFTGDLMVYDVVLTYGGNEIARTSITVRATGLTLTPDSSLYYPGESVKIDLVTTHTADVFYVQIVNETEWATENWTGQTALSGVWTKDWVVSASAPDGQYWLRVRDAGSHAIWYSTSFWIQKYDMMVDSDRSTYLPGETAKITYIVYDVSTRAPYTNVNISASAHYLNSTGNDTWANETLLQSSGSYDFLIPTDIALYSDIDITYWANESTTRSIEDDITLSLGVLQADVDLYTGPYVPGDTVTVYVYAKVSGVNLPGATVNVEVEQNGTPILAYEKLGIVTDLVGQAVHSFVLEATVTEGNYVVNVSVSKVGFSVARESVFNVAFSGDLMMDLDKAYYYGGDTVKMTFRTLWNKQDVVGQLVAYRVMASYGVMLTGSTSTTDAEFTIPATYYGDLTVEATANHNGFMLFDSVNTQVYFANLILTAKSDTFKQGDTIVFNYRVLTSLTEGDLTWEITDNDGVKVASGNPDFGTSGSFEYEVPSSNPSSEYDAKLTMTTSTGAFRVAYASVYIVQDYQLSIWAGKSSYATGEFKPGQKVTVHYSIAVYTQAQLPVYLLLISNDFDDQVTSVQVTGSEGTFTIVVPKSAPNGEFGINAELRDPVLDDHLWDANTKVVVNSQLSAWDKSVGGMSASDFTILILIVLLLLLLIIVPFLKGRMGATKPAPAPAPPPAAPEPPKP